MAHTEPTPSDLKWDGLYWDGKISWEIFICRDVTIKVEHIHREPLLKARGRAFNKYMEENHG